MKKEGNRKKARAERGGAVYLPCFGLVPDSLFGLFLRHCNVIHGLGHVLLYVIYYVTLEKKNNHLQKEHKHSPAGIQERTGCCSMTRRRCRDKRWRLKTSSVSSEMQITTKSRTTPLPQTGLPLRKHGASSNKHVVRLREDQCTCVGCDVKWAVVAAVRPHSNILLKHIQVGSTETWVMRWQEWQEGWKGGFKKEMELEKRRQTQMQVCGRRRRRE